MHLGTMASHPHDPHHVVGQTLANKYEIEEAVAEGGFSVVYRAHHRLWKKPVAVKFFNALASSGEARDGLQEAFLKEGALLAELSTLSTAIVQAWDVGTYTSERGEWLPYMVMEWLEGEALDQRLVRTPAQFTLEEAIRLLRPVAHALETAHQRGIAHRDIKPANLFLTREPGRDAVGIKILDFGVAKVMDDRRVRAALATTGGRIKSFTPNYGAPEQFSRGFGATGPWTDVFALALVMVELLSGKRALSGNEIVDYARVSTDAEHRPTPRRLGAQVSDAVEAVFANALSVDPDRRFQSAGEFWHALEQAAGVPARKGAAFPTNDLPPSAPRSGGSEAVTLDASAWPGRSGESPTPESSSPSLPAATTETLRTTRGGLLAGGVVAGGALMVAFAWAFVNLPKEPDTLQVGLSATPAAVAAHFVQRHGCPPQMVEIPAGQFYMGSDLEEALPNEKPSFNVKLGTYCIDVTEVTLQSYLACSDAGHCKRPASGVRWPKITDDQRETYGPLCNVRDADGRGQHPVNCVSWEMAKRYCEQRGARLPSEAEWEYATRGPDGRIYPWGDDEPTSLHLNACGRECVAWGQENGETLRALYDEDDGFATTAPVGSFPAGRSRFGLMDVVGNVWEWVDDWYSPYEATQKHDPHGPATGERKVIRGGGWNGSYKSWLRPSFRYAQAPDALSHGIGFRCALSLPRDVGAR